MLFFKARICLLKVSRRKHGIKEFSNRLKGSQIRLPVNYQERGICQDVDACGVGEHFSNKIAIASTASIYSICWGKSPGI